MDAAGLETTVSEIAAMGWPGEVSSGQLDVSDRAALATAFDAVVADQGRIDVVFANAGVDAGPGFLSPTGDRVPEAQIDTMPEAQWDRVIDVNLTGVFMTIRNAAHHMKQTGGGRIIVTSSVAARVNESIVGTAYMPAKAGVDHLVRNAAMELAAHGINVNCISPGPFITNIMRRAAEEQGRPRGTRSAVPDGAHRAPRGDQGARTLPRVARVKLRDRRADDHRRRLVAARLAQRTAGGPRCRARETTSAGT